MSHYKYLTVEREGGVLTCTMANPPGHTLVADEVTELADFVSALEADPDTRVVVFTGAGEGVFIAHYDVGELAATAESQTWQPAPTTDAVHRHELHQLILALERARFVTIAAINGSTLGGGLEFALGCDFRLALEGPFQLGLPETSFGLIPGAGGTQRMARLLGTARALDLILHGTFLSPERALELGIVHRVYSKECFRAEVESFAQNLASRAPVALSAAKRAIYGGANLPIEDALVLEQSQFELCMRSEDAVVALRSFLEDKPWSWKGR